MKKGIKMIMKNLSPKKVWDFIIILTLLLSPITLAAEIGGAEFKNLLDEKDQISNSAGYKISFSVIMQYHPLQDPNQGVVFMDCEVTWPQKEAFAMKINYNYEHPPIFVPPNSEGYTTRDYDENGNFMIVRPLEEHILSEPNRNDSLQRVKRFVVDPNGRIVRTYDHATLWRWSLDRPYSVYQFNQLQIAMGRGFSKHLGTVKSAKSLSSGLVKVTSKGSQGPGFEGRWELTIDPNSDFLVREAVFTPDGMNKPITTVTSSGVMEKDGIMLAKYGTLKYSNFPHYSIEVTDISKVVGPNKLYEEVLSRLNSPLPPGASVIDLRGEKHTMTNVE